MGKIGLWLFLGFLPSTEVLESLMNDRSFPERIGGEVELFRKVLITNGHYVKKELIARTLAQVVNCICLRSVPLGDALIEEVPEPVFGEASFAIP
jgi:hypothetical protein